jgi:hypothetical protein
MGKTAAMLCFLSPARQWRTLDSVHPLVLYSDWSQEGAEQPSQPVRLILFPKLLELEENKYWGNDLSFHLLINLSGSAKTAKYNFLHSRPREWRELVHARQRRLFTMPRALCADFFSPFADRHER